MGLWKFICLLFFLSPALLWCVDPVPNSTPTSRQPTPAEFLSTQIVPSSYVQQLTTKFHTVFQSGRQLTSEEWLSLIPYTDLVELQIALKRGALKAASDADTFVKTLSDIRSPFSGKQIWNKERDPHFVFTPAYETAHAKLLESEIEHLAGLSGTTSNHYLSLINATNSIPEKLTISKAMLNLAQTPQDIVDFLQAAPYGDKTYGEYLVAQERLALEALPRTLNNPSTTYQLLKNTLGPQAWESFHLAIKRETAQRARNAKELTEALRIQAGAQSSVSFQIRNKALILEMLPRFSKFPETQSTDVLSVFDSSSPLTDSNERIMVKRLALTHAKSLSDVKAALGIFAEHRKSGNTDWENDPLIEEWAPKFPTLKDVKSNEILTLTADGFAFGTAAAIAIKRAAAKCSKNATELSRALSLTTEGRNTESKVRPHPQYLREIDELIVELLSEWDRFPTTPWSEFVPIFDIATKPETRLAIKRKAIDSNADPVNILAILAEKGSLNNKALDPRREARSALISELIGPLSENPKLGWIDLMNMIPLAATAEEATKLKREMLKRTHNFNDFKTALASDSHADDFRQINDKLIVEFLDHFSKLSELKPSHYSEIFSLSSGSKSVYTAMIPYMANTAGIESRHFLVQDTSSIETLNLMKRTGVKHAKTVGQLKAAIYATPPAALRLHDTPEWKKADSDLMQEFISEWDRFPECNWEDLRGAFYISQNSQQKWAYLTKALQSTKNANELVSVLAEFGKELVNLDPKHIPRVAELVNDSIAKWETDSEITWTSLSRLLQIPLDTNTRIRINELGCKIAKTPEEIVSALSHSGLETSDFAYRYQRRRLIQANIAQMARFPATRIDHYLKLINDTTDASELWDIVSEAFKRIKTASTAVYFLHNLNSPDNRKIHSESIKTAILGHLVELTQKESASVSHIIEFISDELTNKEIFNLKAIALRLVKTQNDLKQINESKPPNFKPRPLDPSFEKANFRFHSLTNILFENAFSPITEKYIGTPGNLIHDEFRSQKARPGRISKSIKSAKDIVDRFFTLAFLFENAKGDPSGHRRAASRITQELPKLYQYAPHVKTWLNFETLMEMGEKDVTHFRMKLASLAQTSDELRLLMPKYGNHTRSPEEYLLADTIVRQAILRFPNEAAEIAESAVTERIIDLRRPISAESDVDHPEHKFLTKLNVKVGFLKREKKEFPVRVIESSKDMVTVVSEPDFMEGLRRKSSIPIYRVPKNSLIRIPYPELDVAFQTNLNLKTANLKPIAMALVSPLLRSKKHSTNSNSSLHLLLYLREYLKGQSPQSALLASQQCFHAFVKINFPQSRLNKGD